MDDQQAARGIVAALSGAAPQFCHPDGSPAGMLPGQRIELPTPVGALVPQYAPEDPRRPVVQPVELHPDGGLKALSLQERVEVATPIGPMAAERITFHPGGQLRRVFPLDGKISAYWDLEHEAALAGPQCVDTPLGRITARILSAHFFASGALRSITLWPGERVVIATPQGPARVSVGFSLYPSGALRSLEPDVPFEVRTPVGALLAFDTDPQGGVAADLNSLRFDEAGAVTALTTATDTVVVACSAAARAGAHGWPACCPDCAGGAVAGSRTRQAGRLAFGPGFRDSLCGVTPTDPVPLRIAFTAGSVTLNDHVFSCAAHGFSVLRGLMSATRTACSC